MNKYITVTMNSNERATNEHTLSELKTLLESTVISIWTILKSRFSGLTMDIAYNELTGAIIIDDTYNTLKYEFYNIEHELNNVLDIDETILDSMKINASITIKCFEWDPDNLEGQFDYITANLQSGRTSESLSVGSDNNINVKEMLFTYLIEAAMDVSEDVYNTFIEYKDNMNSEYMKQLEKDKPSEIQIVKKELEALGAKVILTRTDDSSVSLADRAEISNKNNANAFISIHFDSSEDDSASGTTAYYYSDKSESLSQTVNKYLSRNLPLKNQGSRFQNFMVLRDNARPSILLELGYLNNQGDNKVISSEEYQQNIAKSIANALKEYFQ